MSWNAYELTYRARAPVLLGAQPLGFIQRTRYLAPGWTLWGAITAQLARARLDCRAPADETPIASYYQQVGDFVAINVLTSYAAILTEGEPALPHFVQGEWHYGALSQAAFEARYLTSLGGTAVAPATSTAEVGALRETEALSARDRLTGEPVRWRFTLYLRHPWRDPPSIVRDLSEPDLLAVLEHLMLGADRGYGLGWLERESVTESTTAHGDAWPRPLGWEPGQPLQAHVPLSHLANLSVRGSVETIPRRWWSNLADDKTSDGVGPGQRLRTEWLYTPGSLVEDANWRPVIGQRGVWMREEAHDAAR